MGLPQPPQADEPSHAVPNPENVSAHAGPIKFNAAGEFHKEVRRRVNRYFRKTGRWQRDCPQMYLKTGIIFTWFVASYVLLVFFAAAWWVALPLAVSLALAMSAIGFNVQHDGGHNAYSNLWIVNKLMAMTLDLIGGSSYIWHWKHHVVHHTYVNITGHDGDIDLGFLARMTPHQKRRRFHRFQHLYLWPLYGLVTIKWQFYDDFLNVLTGRIGASRIPRPKGWDLVTFLGGKTFFLVPALLLPLLVHPWWVVLLFFAFTSCVMGLTLSVVFQLAHCVEQADFPTPEPESSRMQNSWAEHQVETTVDFASRNPVVAWLLGGLNFQIEHHLFPRICHVHYPALSKLVKQTCKEFGLRYAEHKTVVAGIASHYRWLRRMGMTGKT